MALSIKQIIKRAIEYVEIQAQTKVITAEFVERFTLLGREDVVISIKTTDKDHPEWWVVGGGTPMNLYSKNKIDSADEAFSFHTGIILRMTADDFNTSEKPPDNIGYDAFISYASEDKETIVRPLANLLRKFGFYIWYDEFELRIGDSLRQSIDKGLVNSNYGIVILSKSFFAKNWPQYELNGLTAKEMDGKKVILPVWHEITKADILQYSPPLADKLAADTSRQTIREIAKAIAIVLNNE